MCGLRSEMMFLALGQMPATTAASRLREQPRHKDKLESAWTGVTQEELLELVMKLIEKLHCEKPRVTGKADTQERRKPEKCDDMVSEIRTDTTW